MTDKELQRINDLLKNPGSYLCARIYSGIFKIMTEKKEGE